MSAVAPTVRLALDIAAQFQHVPAEKAAAEIANHIQMFWDPRMRRQVLAELDTGTDIDPLLAMAAARLRDSE